MSERPSEEELRDQLVQAWRTNNTINLLLLDAIGKEGMASTLSKRGGRGVVGEFAHMHTNRVWQLEKRAKDTADKLNKYAAKETPTPAQLKRDFKASGSAVEQLLVGSLQGQPGRRGFKRGIFTTLSYFISHEAHHRGRILLTLKVSGHTLDKILQMTIWDWDRI